MPESVAVFKSLPAFLQDPRHCPWPSSNPPLCWWCQDLQLLQSPASPLRHYPLVTPRSHQHAPLIRSRFRFFQETALVSGNTFAVAVHVDRSVAEATRIRQSGDHRSLRTGPVESWGHIKRRLSNQQVFASPDLRWVDCDGPDGGFWSQHRDFRLPDANARRVQVIIRKNLVLHIFGSGENSQRHNHCA